MTQELMGKKCGLDRTYISSVERGLRNISIDNMEKMAKAVNKTVPELLVDEIDSTE